MLTPPTAFSAVQNRFGTTQTVILEVTDGTTTWYLSNAEAQLTDGHIYPLIRSFPGIRQKVDIFTRQWSVGNVSFRLDNVTYRQDSTGIWVRLSDELVGLENKTAKIYLLNGDNVKALSDCLLIFEGVTLRDPEYDDRQMMIVVHDKSALNNRLLPLNTIDSVYPDAPRNNLKKYIPLLYGEWQFDIDDRNNDLGLARGELVKITTVFNKTFCFSDHQLHTNTDLFQFDLDLLPEPFRFKQSTLNTNDGGLGTSLHTSLRIELYLYAIDDDGGSYAISGNQGFTTDHHKSIDRDLSTFASVTDFIDEGSGTTDQHSAIIYFAFDDYGTGDKDNLPQLPGAMKTFSNGIIESLWFEIRVETDGDVDWDSAEATEPLIRFYHGTGDANVVLGAFTQAQLDTVGGHLLSIDIDPGSVPSTTTWEKTIGWHLRSGRYDQTASPELLILFTMAGETNWNQNMTHTGNGTAGDKTLLKVYAARLKIIQRLRPDVLPQEQAFGYIKGRKYGTWINSRSSAYASTELIEDPAGIIESLLRDEVSFASADIDLTSFVDAENANVKARINLHSENRLYLNDIIRQLAEQSTFAYMFSAAGTARLIALNNTAPTTDRTIPMSHIKDGKVTVIQSQRIVNEMEYASRYIQERDEFADNTKLSNSASDASFGTRGYSAEWPNIAGTSADHVANFLIKKSDGTATNDDGIWANKHNVIELQTVGFSNADLEVGDWIELDDANVDTQLKVAGTTWAGKQFLVVELQQFENRTKITAIQLY